MKEWERCKKKKDESNQREHNIKSTLNQRQFNVQTLDQRFSTLEFLWGLFCQKPHREYASMPKL